MTTQTQTTTAPDAINGMWYTPPACQGQTVEYSYAVDHDGTAWERRADRSQPGQVTYKALGEPTDAWDPANDQPRAGRDYTA